MQLEADVPKRDITVGTVILSVPQPYKAGHTLNENEAITLNQTLAENLRNNFRGDVDEWIEKKGQVANERAMPELQAEMDEYVAEYEFRTGQGGLRSADPVEAAMNDLALTVVKKTIKGKGGKLADYTTADLNKLRDQVKDKYQVQLRSKAEKQVAEANEFLDSIEA